MSLRRVLLCFTHRYNRQSRAKTGCEGNEQFRGASVASGRCILAAMTQARLDRNERRWQSLVIEWDGKIL